MHQKLLTIKDTLLSSQTSHPPQQSPHKPCRNHHKATRPTLPHQPRNHKTTIPEPASRTSQPHHHQSSSPENHTRTLPRRQTRQENIPAQPPPRTTHAAPTGPTHTTHTPTTNTNPHPPTTRGVCLARICGYTKSSGDRPTSGPRTDHDQDRSASQSTHSLLSTADQGDTAT